VPTGIGNLADISTRPARNPGTGPSGREPGGHRGHGWGAVAITAAARRRARLQYLRLRAKLMARLGKRASSLFSRDARNGSDVATGDRIIVGWQYAPRFAMEMNTDER
jgi:hypothetical protein